MSDNELIVIPTETALQVFTTPAGLDPYLAQVRAEIDAFVPDLSSKKGRDAVASLAYKVAKIKTYLDGVGKDLADVQKEIPKKIDAERKRVRETLDLWKDEVRQPLTDWEEAEEARINRIKTNIAEFQACADSRHLDKSALLIEERLDEVQGKALTEAFYGEYLRTAEVAREGALHALSEALKAAITREAEAVELAKLREEKAARDKADAEERARKEAEERAARIEREKAQAAAEAVEREKKAAEARGRAQAEATARREAELKLQAERAERLALEAQQRAEKAEAEAQAKAEREAAEKIRQEAAEQAKRDKDKALKARVHSAAKEAFIVGGLSEENAKLAVSLIAKGTIPAVTIKY